MVGEVRDGSGYTMSFVEGGKGERCVLDRCNVEMT
jgi:hypothetical protein